MSCTPDTAPMRQATVMEFSHKHSTGPVIGRFLAGLKEQERAESGNRGRRRAPRAGTTGKHHA
jgi:hypothetical protein